MTRPLYNNVRLGLWIAQTLAGAWRSSPPPFDMAPTELESLVPLLLETGAAGLAYWRFTADHSPLTTHDLPADHPLRQAYRLHTLGAAVQEEYLHDLLIDLRSAGIEPLIIKGWSIGRLYAAPGLRPSGDIDLCVRPEDLARTAEVLAQGAGQYGSVDLHGGVADLDDRTWDEILSRSRLVPLNEVEVRILGAEDQLRHLCLHFMRHGAWRPLWLCDVAAALESLPPSFDWDYCFSGDHCLTEWVLCTIGLACRLLGARVAAGSGDPRRARAAGSGDSRRAQRADWLAATVLHLWSRGAASSDEGIRPFRTTLYHLTELHTAVRRRWPNPIRAAFQLRISPFHRLPRRLTQLAAFLLRAGHFAVHHFEHTDGNVSSEAFELHPAAKDVW
jgi:hypothetical protein